MRRLAAILILCVVGVTHAISYTVQVAAVSDQESALSLVRSLLRDGYPAYFVRTTTEAGFVFRIRVGAFQNRGAALVYAEAMPTLAGSRPIPALAEAIPAGIMPFAPALLLTAETEGAAGELVSWNGAPAFRRQRLEPLEEATYHILGVTDTSPFEAWVAAPENDGSVVRVRDLLLWPEPEGEGEDTPEVRAEFAAQLRRLIATQLGVEPAVVDAAEYTTSGGVPALIVLERFRPGEPDSAEVIGLADPDAEFGPYGPETFVVGEDATPDPVEPFMEFDAELASPDDAAPGIGGEGWTVVADGRFARLEVEGMSWRAAVGTPVFATGDLLVTQHDGALLFYRFERRSAVDGD